MHGGLDGGLLHVDCTVLRAVAGDPEQREARVDPREHMQRAAKGLATFLARLSAPSLSPSFPSLAPISLALSCLVPAV